MSANATRARPRRPALPPAAAGPLSMDADVYAIVRRIPPGRVATYGQVASLVGRPRAARAVGGAMRRCPAGVPWHRVVNGQGRISRRKRAASMLTQRMLLEREGVTLRRGRVDLARHAWDAARTVTRARAQRRTAPRAGRTRLRIDDERAWT